MPTLGRPGWSRRSSRRRRRPPRSSARARLDDRGGDRLGRRRAGLAGSWGPVRVGAGGRASSRSAVGGPGGRCTTSCRRRRCRGRLQVATQAGVVALGEVLAQVAATGLLARRAAASIRALADGAAGWSSPRSRARAPAVGVVGERARRPRPSAGQHGRRRGERRGRADRRPTPAVIARCTSSAAPGVEQRGRPRLGAPVRRGGSSPAASRAVMSSAIRRGEDQALEQRVGGQPVGAVHAGAGDLAAGVQARSEVPAAQVGARRRRGRSAAAGATGISSVTGSTPCSRQRGDDRREAAARGTRRRGAGRRARRGRCRSRASGAMIALATTSRGARSASSCWPCMNRTPVAVDQERALAAHRLGDQRLLAAASPRRATARSGGTARTPGRRPRAPARSAGAIPSPVATDGLVVEEKTWPEAAGGEHDRAGVDRADAVDLALAHDVQGHAAHRAVVGVVQQVDDERVLDDLDARVVDAPRCSAAISARWISAPVASPPACAIRSRWWPPSRVSESSPSGVAVELGAERDRARAPASGPRSPGRAPPPRRRARRPATRVSCEVLLGVSAGSERRGDAALRPLGRARVEHGLGDEQHPVDPLAQPQRGGQAGDAGADDDDVGGGRPAGRGRAAEATRQRDRASSRHPGLRRSARACGTVGEDVERPTAGPDRAPARLSISRVVPTRAATASSASPRYHSGTSSRVVRVHQHEVVDQGQRLARRAPRGPPGGRPTGPRRRPSPPARSARDRHSAVSRSDGGEVAVAAGQRQPVGLAHGRHRRRRRPGSRGRAPSAGSAAAAGRPSGRSRRCRAAVRCSSLATTVSTPSKCPGRDAPSSTSPSGPARDAHPGSPSG